MRYEDYRAANTGSSVPSSGPQEQESVVINTVLAIRFGELFRDLGVISIGKYSYVLLVLWKQLCRPVPNCLRLVGNFTSLLTSFEMPAISTWYWYWDCVFVGLPMSSEDGLASHGQK